jgi:chromosome segregation ATPase
LSQYLYNLQDTIPGDTVTEEWRNLVSQQARALDLMLRSLRTNLDALQGRAEPPAQRKVAQLEALARATTTSLATLAQQLIGVEQKLAGITRQGAEKKALPPEQEVLVPTLEQVVNVLHANIIAARSALTSMLQECNSGQTQASE